MNRETQIGIGGYEPDDLLARIEQATGRSHTIRKGVEEICIGATDELAYVDKVGNRVVVMLPPIKEGTPVFNLRVARDLLTLNRFMRIGD